MQKTRSGFTIVELLIVIIVIAILAAISVVAYTGIQDRANNSKRRSDLAMMQQALELSFIDTGRYPASQAPWSTTDCLSAFNWNCWGYDTTNHLVATSYVPTAPQDPQFLDSATCNYPNNHTARIYAYVTNSNGTGFILGTYMPGLSSSDPNYFDGSTDMGCLNFANYLIRKNL